MASGNDMNKAKETYSGFIGLIKWGSIAAGLVGAFVVVLIAS